MNDAQKKAWDCLNEIERQSYSFSYQKANPHGKLVKF